MKMFKKRFLRALQRNWRKLSTEAMAVYEWDRLGNLTDDDEYIPKDVPKGHLVVYVGEECKRFVIHISFLDHPLFRALLDRAREVYEFSPDSKLCIPCDEAVFVGVLRCVGSERERRIWLCFQ